MDGPPGDPTRPETKPVSPNKGLSTSDGSEETVGIFEELSLGPSWEGRHTDPDPTNPGERHPFPKLLVPEGESRSSGDGCFSRSQKGLLGEFPRGVTGIDRSPDGEPTLTGESGILETEHPP